MTHFQKLPQELQLHIAELCTRSTLLSLLNTSKALHQLLTPVLYRVIDLSSHNGPDINLRVPSTSVPSDWPVNRDNPIDGTVYDKQRALIRTLRSHPSLGQHVRILRWTTVDYSQHVEENELMPLWDQYNEGIISRRKLKTCLEEYTFNNCTSRLWDTFTTFAHVLEVDIAFMGADYREAYPPPPLFQHVQSLRLSGMASSFLIRSILKSTNPGLLRHLHLNNPNRFAELEGLQEELPLREKGKLRPFPQLSRSAGPMRTHLLECYDKWCNLQSLIIDTAGLSGPGPDTLSITDIEALEDESIRYRELGTLIRFVANNLRVFRFQQGSTEEKHRNGWRPPPHVRCAGPFPPRDGLRPMDALFHQHILSAILESTWPRLEQMELFGVSSYTCYINREGVPINRPLPDETLSRIRTIVGLGPVLDIRPEATRLFWLADSSEGSGVVEVGSDEWTEDEEDSESDIEEES
ncbi:uncharacterized protein F4822DRAFT_53987 [Hypoxylon trugodes]|uniref:uncharacterized protein n=1 Tax=Hypoxylon trugodes TaxID=326681 RepID=UPI00218F8283|nr:uncharacterized protein F4822DRAFT_53987 [Hypoxylon trugodes]KAI1383865.1 hypothetical protein F4822DRAFT_53987 [Hypoxylon trugodes]